jgi:hypothetical protein
MLTEDYITVLYYCKPVFRIRIGLDANPALTIYLNAAPDPVFVVTLEDNFYCTSSFFHFLKFTLYHII